MHNPSSSLDPLNAYYDAHETRILEDFFTFLRFPSISANPDYSQPLKECGLWLMQYLKDIGMDIELWESAGEPVIFASHMKAGPDKPTLLLYNHYDVQPVDPLEEWTTAPFEPAVREGQVYARGAQDNKGQCFYCVQAIAALLEREGSLPINLKWVIEGEEEIGSANLPGVLKEREKELQADYAVVVDVGIRGPNQPGVTLGVRGLVTMDVEVTGTDTDLHSGSHGGLAYNPNRALVEMLAQLRDKEGRVCVPGFYDEMEPLTEEERQLYSFDFDAEEYEQTFGAPPTGAEPGYSAVESNLIRPTLEINGINGGYSGPGFKTVIPSKATAKISCRLVPKQDPQKTIGLIADYLKKLAPPGLKVEAHPHQGGGPAMRVGPDSPVVHAFAQAYSEVCQTPCQNILEGASIPISPSLAKAAGADLILMGYALSTDCIHAPNEHFGLDRFRQGFLTIARAVELLGAHSS